MKKINYLHKYAAIFITILFSTSCKKSVNDKEISINDQVWMRNNLNVEKFRNGDKILEAKTFYEWEKAALKKEAAWCYYDNNPSYGDKLGKLYNWFAVNDSRGLAPTGYHIPTKIEFETLINENGTDFFAGKKLKSTIGWADDGNGDNESGFNALPGGFRLEYEGRFMMLGTNSYFWTSSESSEETAHYILLQGDTNEIGKSKDGKKSEGYSVRCIKD